MHGEALYPSGTYEMANPTFFALAHMFDACLPCCEWSAGVCEANPLDTTPPINKVVQAFRCGVRNYYRVKHLLQLHDAIKTWHDVTKNVYDAVTN